MIKRDVDVIADGLAEFFKDDPRKISVWLLTSNPHFGGCTPAELIGIRGDKGMYKVARFVDGSMDENCANSAKEP